MPQVARTWRARGMNMLRLSNFSLMAVQRQIAASSSSSPWRTGQHTFSTGFPIPMWTNPPSTSKQSPNLRAFIGHVLGVVGGLGTPPPPPPPPPLPPLPGGPPP